jgi:O-Antigen ligase
MRTLICWLPACIAFISLFFYSKEKVFLNLYLPVLLLLPQSFYALTTGFPKLNFAETTIIPIFLFFLPTAIFNWKFSMTDFFVIGFILWEIYAEYVNNDLHFAINRTASFLCSNFAPYVLAKGLIKKPLYETVAKRIVMLIFADVLLSFFEAITSKNLHVNILSFLFFPENYSIPLIRYGLTRIVGPFGESLFYGMGIAIAILLNYWISRNQCWNPRFKYFPFLKKSNLIAWVLAIGLLLTLSRGPIITCVLAFIFVKVGFSKKIRINFLISFLVVSLCMGILYEVYSSYSEISMTALNDDTEYNVAYRWKLLNVYSEYAWESPWFGWGSSVPPLQDQYLSIDNAYLVLFLYYGIGSLFFLFFMMFWVLIRLLWKAFSTSLDFIKERSLNMTLFSVIGFILVCFLIVFMGNQLELLLFLMVGWAESLILSPKNITPKTPSKDPYAFSP